MLQVDLVLGCLTFGKALVNIYMILDLDLHMSWCTPNSETAKQDPLASMSGVGGAGSPA